jgi:hypothetical protein
MAETNGILWGVEVYRVVVFPLNSDGTLQAESTTVYEGHEIKGPRVFELTPAEPRLVVNPGSGRVLDTIYLPANEASRAELRVGYNNQHINALLTDVLVESVGEATIVAKVTDKQASEPDVALFVTQLAKDSNKLSRWHSYIIPRARAIPMDSPMNDPALEIRYMITMNPSTVHLWNHPLTILDEGCTEAAYMDVMTEGKLNVVAWLADGVEDEFLFPVDKQAISVGKIALFNYNTGAEVTAGITKATTGITYAAAPAADVLLVAKYEY